MWYAPTRIGRKPPRSAGRDSGRRSAVSESSNEGEEVAAEQGLESLLAEYDGSSDLFEQAGRVPLEVMFEALADPGRRYVLTYVLLEDEYVSLSELVDYVVRIRERPDSQGRFRGQLVTDLVQQHLPLLDEAGLIDYRIERQFIGPSEKTRTALPYLELALAQVSATEIDDE